MNDVHNQCLNKKRKDIFFCINVLIIYLPADVRFRYNVPFDVNSNGHSTIIVVSLYTNV